MRSALSLASRAPREPVHRIVHCGVKRAAETGYLLLAHRVECLSVRIVRRYMEPVKGNPEAERPPEKERPAQDLRRERRGLGLPLPKLAQRPCLVMAKLVRAVLAHRFARTRRHTRCSTTP